MPMKMRISVCRPMTHCTVRPRAGRRCRRQARRRSERRILPGCSPKPDRSSSTRCRILWGLSIPGAVGLKFAGLGGSFTDEAQDHLRSKLRDLTAGDLNRPIVAVGWNSERFDGRNLALRLVALGYTRVYWYRGGREAWEVAGLPETEVDVQDW